MFLLQWHAVRALISVADHISELTGNESPRWLTSDMTQLGMIHILTVTLAILLRVHECSLATFLARFVAMHSISAAALNWLWPLENIYLNLHQPKVAHLTTLVSVPFTILDIWSTLVHKVLTAFKLPISHFRIRDIGSDLISRTSSLARSSSNLLLQRCQYLEAQIVYEAKDMRAIDFVTLALILNASFFSDHLARGAGIIERTFKILSISVGIPLFSLIRRWSLVLLQLHLTVDVQLLIESLLVYARLSSISTAVRAKEHCIQLKVTCSSLSGQASHSFDIITTYLGEFITSIIISDGFLIALLVCILVSACITVIQLVLHSLYTFEAVSAHVAICLHGLRRTCVLIGSTTFASLKRSGAFLQAIFRIITLLCATPTKLVKATLDRLGISHIAHSLDSAYQHGAYTLMSTAEFLHAQTLHPKTATFIKAFAYGLGYNLCILMTYIMIVSIAKIGVKDSYRRFTSVIHSTVKKDIVAIQCSAETTVSAARRKQEEGLEAEERIRFVAENLKLSERITELEEMLELRDCEDALRKTEAFGKVVHKKGPSYLSEIFYGLQLAQADIVASTAKYVLKEVIQMPAKTLVDVGTMDDLFHSKIFEEGDLDLRGLAELPPLSTSPSTSSFSSDAVSSPQYVQESERMQKILKEELYLLELKRGLSKAVSTSLVHSDPMV